MSDWNYGQSFFVGASGQTPSLRGMQPNPLAPPLSADWQRWIAENLLRRVDPALMLDSMVKQGIDRATAQREIQMAAAHPYLTAAAALVTGPQGNSDNKTKKREWVLDIYRRSARQASTFGQVPRVRKPSRQTFLDDFYSRNQPVILEGALDDWPALKLWTADYLTQRFGDRMVEVQFGRNANPEYELNSTLLKKEMRFADYVQLVETAGPTNDYYMTANNTGKNKDALREAWNDIVPLTDYLRDDPNNRGFFWFGPQGTVTPLHHDLTNNFMAQVRGRKLVRLIAPYELADVYNHRHCFSRVDLDHIDLARYPQFRNVRVLDVTLNPGDLFFLPVGWWHHVRGLDITITMTFTNFVFDNDFYSFYTTYQDID